MRNIQNIVSNFSNVIARQGNVLVARIECVRSLRAIYSTALQGISYLVASLQALPLGQESWQGPAKTWSSSSRTTTGTSFAAAIKSCVKQAAVVKLDPQRHLIMCHCTAA